MIAHIARHHKPFATRVAVGYLATSQSAYAWQSGRQERWRHGGQQMQEILSAMHLFGGFANQWLFRADQLNISR
jgi:hypothetical protein